MDWAWEVPTDGTAKCVLAALAWHAHPDTDECFPSVASLSRRTGFNERAVQKAIRRLADAGLLEIAERPYQSNTYLLKVGATPPAEGHQGGGAEPPPAESHPRPTTTGGVAEGHQGGGAEPPPPPAQGHRIGQGERSIKGQGKGPGRAGAHAHEGDPGRASPPEGSPPLGDEPEPQAVGDGPAWRGAARGVDKPATSAPDVLTEVEQVVAGWWQRYGHNRAAKMTIQQAAERAVAEFDVDTAFEAMNRLANYRAPDPAYLLDRCADVVRDAERAAEREQARAPSGRHPARMTSAAADAANARRWRAAREEEIRTGKVSLQDFIEEYFSGSPEEDDRELPDVLEFYASCFERAGVEMPARLRERLPSLRRCA